jgi:NAD(P)-dependent dehydrogenase (short-subunit alcohol dehydrogenase family)
MTADSTKPLQGKTCVMTGATSGIGLAGAVELAARGARLVLVARNPARADDALRAIHARTPNATVEIVRGDLARLAEARDAADAILARCPEIHLLWNNAGIVKLRRELTADGFEAMFGVNHLAYFVMTCRLEARLRATPGARIVSTASEAHRFGGALDFDDLQSERSFGTFKTYGRSKLCNILWTRELARRLEGSGVTANCYHPGGVATRLGQTDASWTRLVGKLISPFMRTPEQGASTGVFLATAPEVASVSGRYFAKSREKKPASYAQDDAAARRLWDVTEKLVAGLV